MLCVWLPLNGDSHNQGLCNKTPIEHGEVSINNNGKIGKCYDFNGGYLTIPDVTTIPTDSWSLAAWVYPKESRGGHQYIFGMNTSTSSDFLGVLCYYTDKFGVRTQGTTYTPSFTSNLNTWYHIAATYDGETLKLYINGVEAINQVSPASPVAASTVYIGARGGFAGTFIGCINDARIYDHCLSAKEVEEIAKGLVLHYKLDNNGFGGENILTNSTGFAGTTDWNGLVTVGNENSHPYLIAKRTDTTSTSRTFCTHTSITSLVSSWSPGDSFTISGYYKIPSSETYQSAGNMFIRWVYTTSSGSAYKDTGFYTPTTVDKDVWIRFENTYTVPASYQNGNVSFYLSAFAAQKVSTIYWKDIKLEKGSIATPWSPAKADALYSILSAGDIVYDSSGYNNNGTIVDPLETTTPSPRYSCATKFLGSPSKISDIPTIFDTSTLNNEMTCSFWMKNETTDYSEYRYIFNHLVQIYIHTSGRIYITWNHASGDLSYNANNSWSPTQIPTLNEWIFIAFTFKDGVLKVYRNGEYQNISDRQSTGQFIRGYKSSQVGTNFIGDISDLRLYMTCLSDEQIKELYNTSMAIDNQGNIHARELVE